MSQDDERELSEIGRSIDSLFAQAEAEEAAGPSSEAVEAPVQEEQVPVEEEQVPVEEEQVPVEAEQVSVEVEQVPSEVEQVPVEEERVPGEVEQAPSEPEQVLSEVEQLLSEATSQYLQASVGERGKVERALRIAVEEARSAGALDDIASTVDTLLLQAAWGEDVENLVGELADADVSAQMVARLGRVQVEEERGRLIQAYAILGDRVAKAIATALTDTEDRMARKTYVAALGAFGSAGAHAVQQMLQDSHWFVVRNGVAVLGMVGGPDAIEHLTASLAHEHSGVRRETVLSLAKIGGENAGLLVLSMLGDSDPEVRVAAARAVSALKPERAFKPLMEILEKGDEEEVLEQVLRALGGLGDAAAVSAISKRLKGSMFSSPPTGVRIAGLSALAAIGTPKALSLVEKARADKDREISSAAEQLLAGK